MQRTTRAFSLVELILVVAIIAILGGMAASRMSNRSDDAAIAKLQADIAILNSALDHYAAEHGGQYPDPDKIVEQLTQYTDGQGNVSVVKTGQHIYGPYLRSVPPMTFNDNNQTDEDIGEITDTGSDAGWLYDDAGGTIQPNVTKTKLTSIGLSDASAERLALKRE